VARLLLPTTQLATPQRHGLLRGRAGRHWHPADLGPRVWLDALSVPGGGEHGVVITKWPTHRGRPVEFAPGTAPYYWAAGQGRAGLDAGIDARHPAIYFELDLSQYLQLGGADTAEHLMPNTSGWSCAIVTRNTAGTGYRSPFSARSTAGGTGGAIFYKNGTNWEFWTGTGGATTWNDLTGVPGNDNPTVLIGTCEWGVADSMVFRVNSSEYTRAGTPFRGTPVNARIGAGQNEGSPAFFYGGAHGCMIFFDRKLDAGERLALAKWLGRRYGISITA